MTLNDLLPALQIAIGPVILISGIGLLLLSMTNRLARTVDRSRDLASGRRSIDAMDRERAINQLRILMHRARIMRTAIAIASLGVLFAAMLIIAIFVGALLRFPLTALFAGSLFLLCMISVIAALVLFLWDINLSLRALKVEIDAAYPGTFG